ncbi:primase-helicase zinc-binding domain-containing protein [Maridesulfovibrio ferrireducens]|uniref:primase-helicase zinc-binding domain-containing protein n=1 Tax=Maridesulfovibrio ferrireducens TaxID=246191 RepID=UPI001A239305|nr:primase-helicase zinc-binding domain-containing protein [Maridesulfovibrio ferrireducens]MBI9112272.1 DNA primase [Maridesulfovibrio ferrireducens]
MNLLDCLKDRGLNPTLAGPKHGGEYHSPCPNCYGTDRFRCWPDQPNEKHGIPGSYNCRQCGISGDIVQWFVDVEGMDYPAAFASAGVEGNGSALPRKYRSPAPRKKYQQAQPEGKTWDIPPVLWMEKAQKLVEYAHVQLLANQEQLKYLAGRGIKKETIISHKLGWLPGENGKNAMYRARVGWGLPEARWPDGRIKALWLPRGIVIPLLSKDGEVLRIRIRRPHYDLKTEKDLKYVVVPGSCMATMVLSPSAEAFAIIEAELDAMLVDQECKGLMGAVSVMNDAGKPDSTALPILQAAKSLLVALDFDKAKADGTRPGTKASKWWTTNFDRAVRWPVPAGKDPGDAFQKGVELKEWALAGLPPVFKVREREKLKRQNPRPVTNANETSPAKKAPVVAPEAQPKKEATPLGSLFAFLDGNPTMYLKFYSTKKGDAAYAPAPADNQLVTCLTSLMIEAVDEIEKNPMEVAYRYGKPRTG